MTSTGWLAQAHLLVCFLAYVLWKTLGQMCQAAGLGSEARQVLREIGAIQMVDVVLPTRQGVECIFRTKPITDSGRNRSVIPDETDQ